MTERHEKRIDMPQYDYDCADCHKTVTITASIAEMEAGLVCPVCGGRNIDRIFTPISSLGGCADSPTSAPG
jgi:putative FmdB family regulatory protein